MLHHFRERLVLALIILLPFHALGVTVLTRIILGANQPPLGAVALWKEAVLGVVLLIAIIEWGVRFFRREKLTADSFQLSAFRIDRLDVCILVVTAGLLLATVTHSSSLSAQSFLYGIRYDLVPLAAFFILRRAEWSEWFIGRAPFVLGITAAVAAVYALITIVLPESFFAAVGYSDLHSLYVPGRPIAAFQQIGGTAIKRLQGAMSGPNQLGLWLVVAFSFQLSAFRIKNVLLRLTAYGLPLTAIVLTFSRTAWIATAVILAITLWPAVRRMSVMAVTIACIGTLTIALAILFAFPSVVLRIASSSDHVARPLDALNILVHEPLGRGLGSAGPASNRVSDACIFAKKGMDVSWALPHQDLCVFVGSVQVQPPLPVGELRPAGQPAGKTCSCPLLPENWYLQLGVEGGLLAMIAFIVLIVLVLRRLWLSPHPLARPVFLSMLAISIGGLLLHAWEDSAVAYTVWMFLAVVLMKRASSGSRPASSAEELLA